MHPWIDHKRESGTIFVSGARDDYGDDKTLQHQA